MGEKKREGDPILHPNPDPNPSLESAEVEKETVKDIAIAPASVASSGSWFTPKKLLLIFCIINLLNYIDRGAIASNGVNGSRKTCSSDGKCTAGTGIQGAFNLNNFHDGMISSAFMVGLLVASPIFATLAKSVNPFRLIGVGLTVWTFAVAFSGFSFNFWSIAISRMLVGVGEASFISLAAPFIDDNAPVTQRTTWLGAFYLCIPTGIAIGYVYGGLVGEFNWRWAFWIEAILMLPFVIFGFVMKPLQLKGFDLVGSKIDLTAGENDSEDQGGDISKKMEIVGENSKPFRCSIVQVFGKDMKALLVDKVFLLNVLGYIAYNFVIGAYSYWGPKAGYNIYHMKNADYMFGGVTAVCGIFGTLAGGFILDSITSTITNAFKLLSLATLLGAGFCFAAFCLKSLYGFLALFAIGQLMVFATQAPVNFVCLHCVRPDLRALSMAVSTVAIHIFGDVPSSPLVGLLQDHINNWRKTALILTSILFLAALIWFIGIFMNSVDKYDEENNRSVTVVEKTNTTDSLPQVKITTETA